MLKQHITQTASAQPAPVTNSPAFPPGPQQNAPLAGLPSPARGTRPEQREEWVEQLPWDELFPDPRRRDSRRKFLSLVSQHTNEDTGQAFLRVETIARKVGMTPRTAQRCRRDLEQARLLFVEDRGQLHRCSVFSINFGTFVTPNHDVGVPDPDVDISTHQQHGTRSDRRIPTPRPPPWRTGCGSSGTSLRPSWSTPMASGSSAWPCGSWPNCWRTRTTG